MKVDLEKIEKTMKLLETTEDDAQASYSGLFLIQCTPSLVAELKAARKVVEAARKSLVEIVGRDGTRSHYVQLGVVERIAREALKAMKELDGENGN